MSDKLKNEAILATGYRDVIGQQEKELTRLRAENASLQAEVELTGETVIEFTIKPLKGRNDLSPFKARFEIDEFEDNGLAQLLIDEGYWDFMGHPCDSYTILKREIVTLNPTTTANRPQTVN